MTRTLPPRLFPFVAISVLASPAPFAIAVVWAVVTRQLAMLLGMYVGWLTMACTLVPFWRQHDRERTRPADE